MRYLCMVLSLALGVAIIAESTRLREAAAQEGAVPPTEVEQSLEQLREVVTDPEGAIQTAVSDINKMKKVQFSGYVQARYENHQRGGGPGSSTRNMFNVRRARLKATARPVSHTALTLQGDFGGTSVSLKDAWLDWFPAAAEQEQCWVLSAGQMKWPFGYQVVQSSSVRETPERAQVIQRLFPGERDRGVMITSRTDRPVWGQIGLFNGAGANANDNNNTKDWVGRVRFSPHARVDLGASLYLGRALSQAATAPTPPTTGFVDANGNGVRDAQEPTIVIPEAPARPALETSKTRYGVDAQLWPIERVSLKAEYVTGKEYVNTTTTKGVRTAHGWYAQATYGLASKTTTVIMYDTYRDGSPENSKDIWHLGGVRYLTDATRVKLFYQIVGEPIGRSRKDDVLQMELITLF